MEISAFLADMSYFYFLFLFNNFVFLCLILTYSLETHVMLILILIDIEHLQNVPFSFQKVGMVKITPRHISTIHKYSSAAKFPVTPLHWKGQISILLTSSYDREKFAMFPTAWVATTWGKHCFHDYICVTLILVLWDLSILFLVDYLWPFIIYIYIYICMCMYI